MPTPITTALGPRASPCISINIPATLRPRHNTSLGHFKPTAPASLSPMASSARTTANPTARLKPANVAAPCENRHNTENVSAPPTVAYHGRFMRPRPAVCHSAASTLACDAPAWARCSNSVLVESASSTISTVNGAASPNACAIRPASSITSGRASR